MSHEIDNEAPSTCCRQLRCKSMYYSPDERPGMLRNDESMGYWCNKTHEDFGPDGRLARHCTCQAGRTCHEAGPAPLRRMA